MPDPVKAPPEEVVIEIKDKITLDIWEKYKNEPSKTFKEMHERDTKMINGLIAELAIAKAIIQIYEAK